ncbi:hypothetical protein ACTQ56_07700 [[Clostridium] aminophilum]|uniref:hypothetical protein n=1 Tax=[Clostridium] aminophilum TaxID=1526 RepID=UPI0026EE600D|nr:hypothetical protein [[Clostridium] aminophilum]MDD6195282.1 hypothetical protein [[Clostridium] aminophilum]
MATKSVNFKMDEAEILDIKQVASIFNLTMTDIIKQGIKEYVSKLKQDPFYRLTSNIQDASAEESEEILKEIGELSDDDLTISSSKRFTV